ncbi:MAG: carboxypeptidase regulatory-like domain-containing protein, partial [Bryobacterales bacterium]|nr:carboxypeptidase regulatory-like domain-containing protein [Bryobacterales bacterium]
TGLLFTSLSGAGGQYRFLALPAGGYRLHFARDGFVTLRRDGIVLRAGERASLDLNLEVGNTSQSLEVTAAAPLLQASRGTVSFAVEQQKIVTLPLDGRNFVPLIALSPGVSLPPGSLLPRINGSRPRVSEYIYDGISVLQPEPGQVALYPVIDAIAEFRVELNSYSAEYGRSNGGVILVHQKSGTNEWRGTLFEFFRHEQLNARNLFATTGPPPRFRRQQYGFTVGGPLQRNRTFFFADWQRTRLTTGVVRISTVPTPEQRAGVFASPIFDPATTRRVDGVWRRDAFANQTIPASRLDRAAQAVVDRYPAPNAFTATGAEAAANNYRRTGNDSTAANQLDGRLDRYFATKHRMFARYSYLRDANQPTTPMPDGSGNLTSGVIGNTLTRAASAAAEHTLTASPTTVNQLRLGYTRRQFARSSGRLTKSLAQATRIPHIPASSFADVLPTYDLAGYQQLGPPVSGNARFTTSVTQIIDTYSLVKGSHSLKAGADIRRQTLDVLQPPSPTGHFQFTSIFTAGLTPAGAAMAGTGHAFASFLTGQVGRFSIDAQPEPIGLRARIAEFFIQDDWRLSRQVSMNLGLRYTLNFPSTVVENRGAVFNLATQQLERLGTNGTPRGARNLEKHNAAPRVGIAFQAAPSFVLRAGYGLTWIEQAGITTPFTTPLFPYIQTLGQQTLDNLNPAFVLSQGPSVTVQPYHADAGLGQGVFGVQRTNGSGYAQQWNFTLQKTFRTNWSAEAGYLGSKLTRLGVPDVNLNQLTVEQLALGAQLTQPVANPVLGQIPAHSSLGSPDSARGHLLRPYPRFTSGALSRTHTGHSTYHSFQGRVEKRFSRGLTFTAAYTFSRLIDDAGAVFDSAILTGPAANFQAADSFNKRLEKDASTGNVPHIFSSGFVYELPFGHGHGRSRARTLAAGWQIAGIVRAQSGSPLAVTQATNFNAFAGFGIQRPNRLADPTLPGGQRATGRWFNTAAFAPAGQFTIGNASRNPAVGPGYQTLDVMLGKTFRLSERLRAEVRAECFNLTNTPPLGSPNGSFGAAAFGTITTALDPRVFEFVLKTHF